jgi:hypothetical protein
MNLARKSFFSKIKSDQESDARNKQKDNMLSYQDWIM